MLRRLVVMLPAALCALLGIGASAQAATSYFLEIDGVQGESQSKDHKGAIDVQSYSWGVSNDGGKGKKGLPNFSNVNFSHNIDSASPALVEHTATGQAFAKAKLSADKSGDFQFTFLEYCFTDVVINSVQDAGSSGGDRPTESVSFSYSKFGMRYTRQDAKGGAGPAVLTGWDLVGNKTIGFQDACGTPAPTP